MQFKQNADVFGRKGEKVGVVDRVVIDPSTEEITYLVVKEGFIFTEEKLVPLQMIDITNPERILLKATAEETEKFPSFKETEFVPINDEDFSGDYGESNARSYYWYPSVGSFRWNDGFLNYYLMPRFTKYEKEQIPEGTVALREGAKVISKDGQHVGDVESVFADPEENQVTHFLISQGLLFKEHRLVPIHWRNSLMEDRVMLNVDADFLETIPEYQLPIK